MAHLQDILYKVSLRSVHGELDREVHDLQTDSRKIGPDSIFIALKGTQTDGHQFIPQVIEQGATPIVCEELPADLQKGITYIQVENTAAAAGYIASNFYGQPSERLKLVGVTGTNGKTTIATLLYKLFTSLGYKCGLLSTVQNQVGERIVPATHTTPDALHLNALLKEMVDEGCTHAFMETSSHAIHQQRIAGLKYAGGLFSNITHDHLDYHKTFEEYIRVKKSFFDSLPSEAFAISNADDKRGAVMLQNTNAKKYFYSLKTLAEFKGRILENNLTGLVMTINEQEVHFRLIGEFNAYNLLAVYGAAICLGEEKSEVLRRLSTLTGAERRFYYILYPKEKIIGIVDYAHTPDALINVLTTIQKLRKGHERVITVVGCGGDRDKAKRPLMAAAAAEYSDKAILTSDNPRSEEPGQFIGGMEAGLNTAAKRKYIAINHPTDSNPTALQLAATDNIFLFAGECHEKYPEIKGVKYPFDDKQILLEFFELLDK